MDNRVLNTLYSVPPMVLFAKLANLCVTVSEDQGPPCVPYVLDDKRTISQQWGMSPPTGGTYVYFRLGEDGETVYLWDPEANWDLPEEWTEWTESMATHTFKLEEMDSFIPKWLNGEI